MANHDTPYDNRLFKSADYYVKGNMPDSALPYATQAYQLALKVNFIEQMPGIQMNLGNIHSALGDDDIALPYFRKSIANAQSIANYNILSRSYYSMARLFSRAGRLDSSFYYNRKSYEIATKSIRQKKHA
jgi:tetratricopeptide (TPR) repeat protein